MINQLVLSPSQLRTSKFRGALENLADLRFHRTDWLLRVAQEEHSCADGVNDLCGNGIDKVSIIQLLHGYVLIGPLKNQQFYTPCPMTLLFQNFPKHLQRLPTFWPLSSPFFKSKAANRSLGLLTDGLPTPGSGARWANPGGLQSLLAMMSVATTVWQ